MEFWGNMIQIFMGLSVLFVVLVFFVFGRHNKMKSTLQPIQYISYKKEQFNKDFDFTCEFCGTVISTKLEECTGCGGAYGKNKEYKSKKRIMNQNYLDYLKMQETKIVQEQEYIKKTKEALRKNKLMKNTEFNFVFEEPPIYKPATAYEFACEYCDNILHGKSTDETGCSNCGASYKENFELLVREEEDMLEKRHYEEYLLLKDIEWNQNIMNEQKDAYIENKYNKQINFLTKYAKFVALAFCLVMFLLAMVITALVM